MRRKLLTAEGGDFQKVEDPDIEFKPSLSFQYRHAFSESMTIETGIAVYYGYTLTKESGTKRSMWQICAEGNVGISFEPAEHLAVKAGAKVFAPIHKCECHHVWHHAGV